MRKLFIILLLAAVTSPAFAQEERKKNVKDVVEISISDTLTDAFLDTVQVKKKLKLNDYSLIGVQYGVTMSQMMWNPSKKQKSLILPVNFGVTYTIYGKMFGYMPYFGLQTGIFYGKEGYHIDNDDKEENRRDYIEGAEKVVFDVIEVPVLSHFHFDFWHFKIIAQLGLFGGYRLGIHRYPGEASTVREGLERSFTKTDIRFDYGIKGGVGFGLVFDPVEIHIQAMYKHSLSSIYEPDHYSQYYYRYAYPSNLIVSAGIHFQLTKRSGMTQKELKKQARSIVYGEE